MIALPRVRKGGPVALLAGLAAALAHPPFGFLPGLLGFSVLYLLLLRSSAERPLRSAFWRAWLFGLAYFTVSLWWISEAFMVDVAAHGWQAPFAVAGLAGGLALLWGLAAVVWRTVNGKGLAGASAFAAIVFLAAQGKSPNEFAQVLPVEPVEALRNGCTGAAALLWALAALLGAGALLTHETPAEPAPPRLGERSLVVFVWALRTIGWTGGALFLAGFHEGVFHQPLTNAPLVILSVSAYVFFSLLGIDCAVSWLARCLAAGARRLRAARA